MERERFIFTEEKEFEKALIKLLTSSYGWDKNVLVRPTEDILIKNWAKILFKNNESIDRLNHIPLTTGEIDQILEQIKLNRTPMKLNEFINGKTISIKRDNPLDALHLGKEISLKIYDRDEIAGGKSVYQIAEQPIYKAISSMNHDRRGDITLLINGMPLIHIELKRSGVDVSEAYNQIEKYSKENVFSGIFSLIQIFVAMTPDKMLYFANPGQDGKFNKDFYFHWADFNNQEFFDYRDIAAQFLSIPMAHQLIGFYTVPDKGDGILKVLRSYQYYACRKIMDKVIKYDWERGNGKGGYIAHTTGSGKTLTSFKAAQLIANSKDADKVVFLMDRIELTTQSSIRYDNFSSQEGDVKRTASATDLLSKLKSNELDETLIVTSIQKMSRIKNEGSFNDEDVAQINRKRIVIIVDECHRSVFGDMLATIKETFPSALFFGFSGTPILKSNAKKVNVSEDGPAIRQTTLDIFGDELHRYLIMDAINDGNVLGFDPTMVSTFSEDALKEDIAMYEAKAKDKEELISNPEKMRKYYEILNLSMAGHFDEKSKKYVKGIEDYIPNSQYNESQDRHHIAVVNDIIIHWQTLSHNSMFHAILATSSINEAIKYYHLFKKMFSNLKVTTIFDPDYDKNLRDGDDAIDIEQATQEILDDYDNKFNQRFFLKDVDKFKKDVAARLSHADQYERLPFDNQINLVIVVNQLLTGFDSKWLNTLYFDKYYEQTSEESIIQAFSRTNRIYNRFEKPYGIIRYYRKPHSLKRNYEQAFKDYSGQDSYGVYVSKLKENLVALNLKFETIKDLFEQGGVQDFEKLPLEDEAISRFAKLFVEFTRLLNSARIQGFSWKKDTYDLNELGEEIDVGQQKKETIKIVFTQYDYIALEQRYKEIASVIIQPRKKDTEIPFDIEATSTSMQDDKIDQNYLNSKFKKFLKSIETGEEIESAMAEIHKNFALLSAVDQKYGQVVLDDVRSGDLKIPDIGEKDFYTLIIEAKERAQNDGIRKFANSFGVPEDALREYIHNLPTDTSHINDLGKFDELVSKVNKEKAKQYLEEKSGFPLLQRFLRREIQNELRSFIFDRP